MKKLAIILVGALLICSTSLADQSTILKKPWNVLAFFDGENAELEKICEYNINQLEQIHSAYVKIVAVFDRPYNPSRDSSVRIYDIIQDDDRTKIFSNSISIGERDMGSADVLDEFLSKYLGNRNILVIKAHGYGIISPGALKIGYNSSQDPFVIRDVLRRRLDKPLDVMVFDSCNMASVEVAYEFKDLVSVMVGSQDLMYYSLDAFGENAYASRPGIDYTDLVVKLTPHSNPITVGKNIVTGFTEVVSKKDALYHKATISALDLDSLDIAAIKNISNELISGITHPKTQQRYLAALKHTLETASHFNPLGRHHILTHYDIEDFLNVLEDNLDMHFDRPDSPVIQSYSNTYVKKASGLSILFFKDLSEVSSARKKELFDRYSRSKFARETGWDELMRAYHKNVPGKTTRNIHITGQLIEIFQ